MRRAAPQKGVTADLKVRCEVARQIPQIFRWGSTVHENVPGRCIQAPGGHHLTEEVLWKFIRSQSSAMMTL